MTVISREILIDEFTGIILPVTGSNADPVSLLAITITFTDAILV